MNERKPRPDKKLAALTPNQAEQLWAMMRSGASYKTIATAVKKEFEIEVSTRALSEWWEERAEQEARDQILRATNLADKIGKDIGDKLPEITKALKGQLTQKAFELGMTGADPKHIEQLMNIVGSMNQAELTKAKIALEMEKFRESIKTQQDKALDALFVEIRGNKQAEQLFLKFRDAVRGAVQEAA